MTMRATVAALLLIAALGVGCGGNGDDDTAPATTPAAAPGTDNSGTPSPQADDTAPAGNEVHADPLPGGEVQGFTQPTTPAIDAQLTGQTVVIRYRYPPPEGDEEEPWMLLTSIDPAGDEIPPLTRRTPLQGKTSGVIRQPLGVGDPPYELLVATLAGNGLQSRSARIPLSR